MKLNDLLRILEAPTFAEEPDVTLTIGEHEYAIEGFRLRGDRIILTAGNTGRPAHTKDD